MTYKDVVRTLRASFPVGRANGKMFAAMVIRACEKQVEKKVIRYEDHTIRCATCFHELKYHMRYCEMCGQKVWKS